MGREIRRVPKGWEHPVNEVCRHIGWYGYAPHDGGPCYVPMHDKDYTTAAEEWIANFSLWQQGKHPYQGDGRVYYWDAEGMPPNKNHYRPAFDTEPTCYQIYETVSEGTPTSPVFDTLDVLAVWLIGQGTSEAAARAFARDGWAASMVVERGPSGVKIWQGIETAGAPDGVPVDNPGGTA